MPAERTKPCKFCGQPIPLTEHVGHRRACMDEKLNASKRHGHPADAPEHVQRMQHPPTETGEPEEEAESERETAELAESATEAAPPDERKDFGYSN